ncbi:PKD domain-containing protein [Owenweeksia hongkongensis]|uniref:PKD domain-containing protein n=1 Tax=Owenweeksia hongkongensis TaxID=253245 RepID=UPI003A8D4294
MKKFILFACLATCLIVVIQQPELTEKDKYRHYINSHEFNTRPHLNPKQIKQIPKKDRPDLAWEQNFLATMDPSLGHPSPEKLFPIYEQITQAKKNLATTPGSPSTPWVERGPSNVSGRTRAIVYDPNDVTLKKVWAGGVSGGLWYNNDITSASSQWNAVDDFWDNIAITAIAFDPTNSQIIYVGTGEGWNQSSSGARGAGIWKSINGGTSWTHLSSTSGFYFVNDLVVRNEGGNGVLYAAIKGFYYMGSWHGSAQEGLQRSTNGGTSFTQVLPNVPGTSSNFAAADIEIGTDNKLWIGTMNFAYSGTDRGGGRVLTSTNGTTWSTSYTHSGGRRVEVACAPNSANHAYAMIESSATIDGIVKTTNNGTSWSAVSEPNDADGGIPSTDFSRGQAWYDMILAVDPNNSSVVFAGAVDLFKSTNSGSSWSQIAHWYGGFGFPEVHADQHAIVFKPGSSTEVLFGNDGGVYRSTNASSSSPSFSHMNNGYNITQFYACAIHPTAGNNYFLAGSQDNGSHQFANAGINSTTEVTGGDGAYCFIDQTNPNYQVTSYVYNNYWRSTDGGNNWGSRFQSDQSTGKFINPTDYDDNMDILYSTRTTTTINRVTNMTGSPSVGSFTVSGMNSMASHLRVSPYTTTSTTLFVGTEAGDFYKITNADGGSPSTSSIGGGLPAGNISCVEIGANENELLVTYTNYGITSVWYTSNGGTTWASKEGNLPDMPVRWALFNPNDRTEVLLATEVGVWSTSNFSASSPTWAASNSGLANVRVDMLQMRDSDNEVIAATHGRGLFSSSGFASAQAPVADFGISTSTPCTGQTATLSDSSTGNPTSWAWTITPSTFSYGTGSSASSQNPEVTFNTAGTYSIKLVVSNANGIDSLEIAQAVQVGGQGLPFSEDFEGTAPGWTVDNPDNGITWGLYTVAGSTPGIKAAGVDNYSYNSSGQRDGLLSPAINLNGVSQATLTFDYAYRRYNTTYSDSLAVYISTDCGATFTQLALYGDDGTGSFATGIPITSGFTPTSATDWCGAIGNPSCPSIDISSYTGNNNVVIKFENITDYGNNMYIDNVNITGSAGVAPVADFSASKTNGCVSDTVVFTDLSTNAPTSWAWTFSPSTVTYVNGTSASSQNPEVIFNGSGNYQVSLNSSNTVGNDSEVKAAYVSIASPVTPSLMLSSSSTLPICAGDNISFSANATNAGTTPVYVWKVNGTVVGTNSSAYSTNALANNDIVSVELQSSLPCSAGLVFASLTVPVDSVKTPSVSISASATSICVGTNVTFTASPVNGGSTPSYQWKVNGSNVTGAGAIFSSSTLSNGDAVSVELSSSENCVTASTVSSNTINMSVSSAVAPSVSISSNDTIVCQGSSSIFSAAALNAGASPSYQWKVNGINAGVNSPTFISTLNNNDAVTVEVTSSLACASPTTAISASKTVQVVQDPVITNTTILPVGPLCKGDTIPLTTTVNSFGNPGIGHWNGPGVANGKFIAGNVATGSHTLFYSYSYVNSPFCSQSISLTVNVENVPKPTISNNNMVLTCNEAGYNYQWILNGNAIPGATAQTHTATGNGTYSVQIGLTGCSDQSDPLVINDFGMDDLKAALGFKLFPNPAKDESTFELINPGTDKITYELIAFNGAVVLRKEISAGALVKEKINLSQLAAGFYTLQIKAGEHKIIEKLGKQ